MHVTSLLLLRGASRRAANGWITATGVGQALKHLHDDASGEPSDHRAQRQRLLAKNKVAVNELKGILGDMSDAPKPSTSSRLSETELGLARDATRLAGRARLGIRDGDLHAQIGQALARAGLDGPSSGLGGGSAGRGTELRARRDAAWENIVQRGVDAEGVGAFLRGFFRDHGRVLGGAATSAASPTEPKPSSIRTTTSASPTASPTEPKRTPQARHGRG